MLLVVSPLHLPLSLVSSAGGCVWWQWLESWSLGFDYRTGSIFGYVCDATRFGTRFSAALWFHFTLKFVFFRILATLASNRQNKNFKIEPFLITTWVGFCTCKGANLFWFFSSTSLSMKTFMLLKARLWQLVHFCSMLFFDFFGLASLSGFFRWWSLMNLKFSTLQPKF